MGAGGSGFADLVAIPAAKHPWIVFKIHTTLVFSTFGGVTGFAPLGAGSLVCALFGSGRLRITADAPDFAAAVGPGRMLTGFASVVAIVPILLVVFPVIVLVRAFVAAAIVEAGFVGLATSLAILRVAAGAVQASVKDLTAVFVVRRGVEVVSRRLVVVRIKQIRRVFHCKNTATEEHGLGGCEEDSEPAILARFARTSPEKSKVVAASGKGRSVVVHINETPGEGEAVTGTGRLFGMNTRMLDGGGE